MHNTNNPNVKGYLDFFYKKDDVILLQGWCFHNLYKVCKTRVKYNIINTDSIDSSDSSDSSNTIDISDCNKPKFIYNDITDPINTRIDVVNFYNFDTTVNDGSFGWNFKIPDINAINIELEMFFHEKWNTIFTFEKYISQKIVKKVSRKIPSFVVVDNFYENVDLIRKIALSQTFEYHTAYHKGKRTNDVFRFEGLKESFENILNCKIKNWESYNINGCFQICVGGDQLVYHFDDQEYAGIIFLTPNAPPQTGTSFYRSKYTKKMKCHENDENVVFKNGYLDSTEFEVVDVVGNIYNRLVLFDSKMFHAASNYFGTNLENGRLFQLFFFDLDR
jgi:hypothetical protein